MDQSLKKPVGIFATNDLRGQHVLDACARDDCAVPEEVAVIGVDNDELLCSLCSPPLSSVIPNPERIGYEAAAWLDRMLRGEMPTVREIEIPPKGIAVRQSSDVFAVSDPVIVSALRFIREHACEGTTVQELLDHLCVSRSWLEKKFRKLLGRSPQAEIRNVQVKRCKELLRTTDLSLEKIAALTGFVHPEYMSVVFKREVGTTPGQFRNGNGEAQEIMPIQSTTTRRLSTYALRSSQSPALAVVARRRSADRRRMPPLRASAGQLLPRGEADPRPPLLRLPRSGHRRRRAAAARARRRARGARLRQPRHRARQHRRRACCSRVLPSEDEYERMPPEGKPLTPAEIDVLRRWIAEGAKFEKHWAFVPPKQVEPPAVERTSRGSRIPSTPSCWRSSRPTTSHRRPPPTAAPSPAAPTTTSPACRPPPNSCEPSSTTIRPDAWEKLVDTLLASPHYGERWARHWLDLVRYAETNSFERDGPKPNAWKYRDYVIRCFNDDKPYDQFVREQLAGDELDEVTHDSIIATGYYRLGIWDDEPADPVQSQLRRAGRHRRHDQPGDSWA